MVLRYNTWAGAAGQDIKAEIPQPTAENPRPKTVMVKPTLDNLAKSNASFLHDRNKDAKQPPKVKEPTDWHFKLGPNSK